jgi:hypothetical protein
MCAHIDSLGGIFWDTRVATNDGGSQCGIKSGIEIESLIVEKCRACQAKVSVTLKQTASQGLYKGVGSGGDDGTK